MVLFWHLLTVYNYNVVHIVFSFCRYESPRADMQCSRIQAVQVPLLIWKERFHGHHMRSTGGVDLWEVATGGSSKHNMTKHRGIIFLDEDAGLFWALAGCDNMWNVTIWNGVPKKGSNLSRVWNLSSVWNIGILYEMEFQYVPILLHHSSVTECHIFLPGKISKFHGSHQWLYCTCYHFAILVQIVPRHTRLPSLL